ncbi:hypothetical protein SPF06_17595 [Sinomonas sp. JGH33]|uniref:Uncharacterized protein n=1 Tax=Sinomonas terricola TaxID=3110330 RepID=A0ABU5TA25_9MICC|nr:hypothetical protein [Sinomonas sp. JGH33]MEA5456544.1 hypothetical protein [Sinomonas sp. JGH33]
MDPTPSEATKRSLYTLEALIRVASTVHRAAAADLEQALALGNQDEAIPVLLTGASILARAEFEDRPEGLSLAILDRAEQILHDTLRLPRDRTGSFAPASTLAPRGRPDAAVPRRPLAMLMKQQQI